MKSKNKYIVIEKGEKFYPCMVSRFLFFPYYERIWYQDGAFKLSDQIYRYGENSMISAMNLIEGHKRQESKITIHKIKHS